ncbi:MAG: MMPL family transporter [Aquisalimonadaceae bacterium]
MSLSTPTSGFRGSPWSRILLALGVVIALAIGTGQLRFDNSTDAFFISGDDTLADYEHFRDLFASDEYSFITLRTPDVLDSQFITALQELERALARVPHVRDVTSLASVRAIEGGDGMLQVSGFLDDVDETALAERMQQAARHPYYQDLFVSADGSHLGIVVETEIIPGEIAYKLALRENIRAAVAASPLAQYQPTIVGAPILDADVRDIVERESGLFGALVFLLVGAGFYFVFRSWMAVALPLLVAVLSVVSTFGLMGWLDMPVTLLTPILPSFLISVGVGSSIFILTRYFQRRAVAGSTAADAVHRGVRDVWLPCVLASLTTIGSLLAFASSEIVPVRHVGLALGMGLGVALFLTFTLGTAVLALAPPPVSQAQAARLRSRSGWLLSLDRFASRHGYLILAATLGLTVIAALNIGSLKLDYYYLGTFKEHTGIFQDYQRSDARLPRSSAIEVILHAPAGTDFRDPAQLRRIEQLQQGIAEFEDLPVKSYSVADVTKEINQALHDGSTEAYRIPEHANAVAQGLLLFESSGSDEMTRLVSPDYSIARVTVQLPTVAESRSRPLRDHIEAQLATAFADSGVSATLTGVVPMWLQINSYLRSTQIKAVLLAFCVTTLVLMIYARSLVIGAVLACVNASVVLLVLGFMAMAGWPLDPYTVLIANIAIGILDDDTFHMFTDIRERLQLGQTFDEAIAGARESSGQAISYLAFCLIAGFLVYLFSSVASLSMFGCLVALVIFLGLIWEVFVMPAYLGVLHRMGLFGGTVTKGGAHAYTDNR